MQTFKKYLRESRAGKPQRLITEAIFRMEDLKKVCEKYGSLLAKGLGGAFKIWTTEDFERDGESGSGVRMVNINGHMIRLNFSDILNGYANNKAVVLSSIDYWQPGNVDLECPDVTCRFLQEVNVIQIWKKLADIIFNGQFGKYTAGDLGGLNEDIEDYGTVRARKDFLTSKGISDWKANSKETFKKTVDQKGLESEWNTYIANVVPGRPETNSTEQRMKKAETNLKKVKYADPDVVFKDIVTLTKELKNTKRKLLTICGMGGLGKCIDVDTLVATPNGNVRAGDLKVGDQIFTPKNTIANIVEVYPQAEKKECFEVTLSDGRSVIADEEQLFNVKLNKLSQDSNYGKFKNVPLKEIIKVFNEQKEQLISEGKWDIKNSKFTHIFFPISEAIEYKHKDVDVDPYLLGLLIGDGGLTQEVSFSNNDENTVNWLKEHIEKTYNGYTLKYRSGVDYNIVRENYDPKGKTLEENKNILKSQLNALGLMKANSHDKFIPEVYKFNDINTRMELVRGLMDTDGYVAKGGNTSYCTVSERLANDFVEVIRSLGGKANIYVKEFKYNDTVKHSFNVNFVLPFKMGSVVKNNILKVERYNERLSKKEFFKKLTIADIKPVGLRDTVCFLIDDPDHLFVTSDYMVVHNTYEVTNTLSSVYGESPNKDWVYIPAGKFTTLQFFQEVFNARDRIICFDEADNLLNNDEIVTMLKPALDTSGSNQMTYNTGTKPMSDFSKKEVDAYADECDFWLKNGVQFVPGKRFNPRKDNVVGSKVYDEDREPTGVWIPSRFFFTGKMIFISNMPMEKIDQALLSRGPKIPVNLTLEGKIARIATVLKNMGYPEKEIDNIMVYLGQQEDSDYISVRTAVAYIDYKKNPAISESEAARLAAMYG